jgi:hypothetical protein
MIDTFSVSLCDSEEEGMSNERRGLAAPCGLYCGNCTELLLDKACHGCGCDCGQCAAGPHHAACDIHHCVSAKGLRTCAECDDLPCTLLIQFAYDPIWQSHLPVLESLRRIRRVGVDAWLGEQEAYWADRRRLEGWLQLQRECESRYQRSASDQPGKGLGEPLEP